MSDKKRRGRHREDDDEGLGPDEEIFEEFDEEEWRDLAEDPEMASRLIKALEGLIPGVVKRAALSGIGNVLLSEDGLRSVLAENKKLPKEAVGLIMSQADAMRREILRIISREIRIFLENVDFGGEIAKILTSVSFEIKTEIRFIPNDQAVKPQIKNKVSAKRARDGEKIPLDDVVGDGLDPDAGDPDPGEAPGRAQPPEDEDGDDGSEDEERPRSRKLRWGRRRRTNPEDEGR